MPAATRHRRIPIFDQISARSTEHAALLDAAIGELNDTPAVKSVLRNLAFEPRLETLFEADTGRARARELAYTMTVGMSLSYMLVLMDLLSSRAIALTGAWIRLIPLPFVVFAVVRRNHLSPWIREATAFAACYLVIAGCAVMAHISSPRLELEGYYMAMVCPLLVLTVLPLRFRSGCVFALICILTLFIVCFLSAHHAYEELFRITFQAALPMPFCLVATYRMERSFRLTWLLATKEARRLSTLEADGETLKSIANTDALTGLANRGHFDRSFAALLAGPFSERASAWLIMLDVDFFKRYNDHYGHPAGDQCLRAIGQVLKDVTREGNDLAFRYGGEEFGVLMLEMSSGTALGIAEQVRREVEQAALPHNNRDDGLRVVTVSVGLAEVTLDSGRTAAELVVDADMALYRAKRQGRNRVVLSSAGDVAAAAIPVPQEGLTLSRPEEMAARRSEMRQPGHAAGLPGAHP